MWHSHPTSFWRRFLEFRRGPLVFLWRTRTFPTLCWITRSLHRHSKPRHRRRNPAPGQHYLAPLEAGSIALLMKSVADPDPTMTSEERAYVTQLLKDSLAEYLSHVESLSEAQWNWKSVPGRWSIGETAEHIMLNEAFLFGVIQTALQSP